MDWKHQGHKYFDMIWRDTKVMTREQAYQWLASMLGVDNAHFSKLDNAQCKEAVYFSKQLLNDLRRLDMDFGVEPAVEYCK